VIVVIAGWIFVLRGGLGASDARLLLVFLLAVFAGSVAGGLVGARPRRLGLALSAFASAGAALLMLSASVGGRADVAGAAAGERLETWLPWITAAALALGFGGAGAGAALRSRFDRRRPRRPRDRPRG
jgi:hypothetical protein